MGAYRAVSRFGESNVAFDPVFWAFCVPKHDPMRAFRFALSKQISTSMQSEVGTIEIYRTELRAPA